MAASHDLFKTIDRESKIDALSTEGCRPSECRGDIVFRDVLFAYPSRPDVQVLRGLDLVIPANKTTAVVGPSGSGKSTIIGLLERWFSPLSGTITLDGRKIEYVNIQWLRTNIRLVQQARLKPLPQQMRPRALLIRIPGTCTVQWDDLPECRLRFVGHPAGRAFG